MSREIRRVPLGFDWPIGRVWEGYLRPEHLREQSCTHCDGSGYSPFAQRVKDRWYGYVAFDPSETGSTPFTPEMPLVKALITAKIDRDPTGYYLDRAWNNKDRAVYNESVRMCEHWNRAWSHHLEQRDVDALLAADRLIDLTHTWSRENRWQPIEPRPEITAKQVNDWSIQGFGHDSINQMIVTRAACERKDRPVECSICHGHGTIEKYIGQREEAEAWQWSEPPEGPGWQLWETTTEGSPKSPVFASANELAVWMSENPCGFAGARVSLDVAMKFVHGDGWSPSMMGNSDGIVDGITAVVMLDQQRLETS